MTKATEAGKADMVFAVEGHTFAVFTFDRFQEGDGASFDVHVTSERGADDWYRGHIWGDMRNLGHAVTETARAWVHNPSYREVARIER